MLHYIYEINTRVLLQGLYKIEKDIECNRVDFVLEELAELMKVEELDGYGNVYEWKPQIACFECGVMWPDCTGICTRYDEHQYYRRVRGRNVKMKELSDGVEVSVNWTCTHCGDKNKNIFVRDKEDFLSGVFEEDLRCNCCTHRSTVECCDVEN